MPDTLPTPKKTRRPMRTVMRTVRFSEEEWADVERLLVGREFSAWVRARLLGGRDHPLPDVPAEPKPKRTIVRLPMTPFQAEKVRQLSWIGNNLNQLAKKNNQGLIGTLQLTHALVQLEREVRRLGDAR